MENELYERWDDILERMKIDFDISDVSFRTFIKKLSLYGVENNLITVLIDDTSIGSNSKCRRIRYRRGQVHHYKRQR